MIFITSRAVETSPWDAQKFRRMLNVMLRGEGAAQGEGWVDEGAAQGEGWVGGGGIAALR